MKYWKLIKVDGKTPSTSHKNTNNNTTDLSENMKQILEYMKNTAPVPAPSGFDETNLNDEQVNDVLTWLLEYQENYFSELPLPDDLDKKFVWNIPKELYNAAKRNKDLGNPECLNPIFWLYGMLLEEPSDMLGKFILLAMNSMSDDDRLAVEQSADEYDYNYGLYDPDDNGGN